MLVIIISKTEPYLNGAELIKTTGVSLGLDCRILYIEDIYLYSVQEGSVFYILTNVKGVKDLVEFLKKQKKVSIINERFYMLENNKSNIQLLLREAGLKTPKNITDLDVSISDVIASIDVPLYVKSQEQANTVLHIQSLPELRKIWPLLNTSTFYLEECVDLIKYTLVKIYYINGYIELKDYQVEITNGLRAELDIAANKLFLKVYSADVFVSKDNAYVYIDINPSPGLFHSKFARTKLIEYVKEISSKTK